MIQERPILFSGAMVRAILDGRKTQTRRVINPQPDHPGFASPHRRMLATDDEGQDLYLHSATLAQAIRSPYGKPGDRLYVREAWRSTKELDVHSGGRIEVMCLDAGYSIPWAPIRYEADGERRNWQHTGTPPQGGPPEPGRYRHARFMPRWASRILLEITGVRVERLNDCSEADAAAEGTSLDFMHDTHRAAFRELWHSINCAESWAANPWVWVVEFRRTEA